MKQLILLGLILLPTFANAQECKTKVDPSKIVLFIDTNKGDLEIETVQKAACARGERLVIVPKNYKEYTAYSVALEKTFKAEQN
jgi:hypothetical protein